MRLVPFWASERAQGIRCWVDLHDLGVTWDLGGCSPVLISSSVPTSNLFISDNLIHTILRSLNTRGPGSLHIFVYWDFKSAYCVHSGHHEDTWKRQSSCLKGAPQFDGTGEEHTGHSYRVDPIVLQGRTAGDNKIRGWPYFLLWASKRFLFSLCLFFLFLLFLLGIEPRSTLPLRSIQLFKIFKNFKGLAKLPMWDSKLAVPGRGLHACTTSLGWEVP